MNKNDGKDEEEEEDDDIDGRNKNDEEEERDERRRIGENNSLALEGRRTLRLSKQ